MMKNKVIYKCKVNGCLGRSPCGKYSGMCGKIGPQEPSSRHFQRFIFTFGHFQRFILASADISKKIANFSLEMSADAKINLWKCPKVKINIWA